MYNIRENIRDLRTESDMLAPVSKDHKDRRNLINTYWRYYRGRHRRHLKTSPERPDDNITINWSKKIVNMSVSFLFGKPFSIDTGGEDISPLDDYIGRQLSDDPRRGWTLQPFLQSVGLNGAVSGSAFVRMYLPDAGQDRIRLVAVNPYDVDIVTAVNDIEAIEEYHIVYQAGRDWYRQRMVNGGSSWEILDEVYTNAVWRLEESSPWPFEFAPLFHCQNLINPNEVWGISDLEDADLNDAVNFIGSNTQRIVRYHAHPVTVGTGIRSTPDQQATGAGTFWRFTEPDAKISNLEMMSDLASSRELRGDMEEAFHQVTDTPRLDPTQVNLGALSGFALQILYGPLLSKTSKKQGTYGGMIKQLVRAMAIVGGQGEVEDVDIKWPNPLPTNRDEEYARFKTLVDGGVSIYAAAMEVWGDADRAERLAETETMPELQL